MAQAFLETDFLLRRATPTPARAPAQATSRPAFVVRDPEPSRAATTARSQESRTQESCDRAARSERDRPDVAAKPERARIENADAAPARAEPSKVERPSAPLRTVRDAPASNAKTTAPPSAGPYGEVVTAGVVGSPEAAMAGAILAEANAFAEAGSVEGAATDGTEEETESNEASAEEPDASLLTPGAPPPPAGPVLQAGAGQTSAHQGEARTGQGAAGQGSSGAEQSPSSTGQGRSPSGAVQPSKGEGPGAVGQDPLARSGVAVTGKFDPLANRSDPAVAVHESARTTDAAAGAAALSLPEGLPTVRESFDSVLAGLSTVPSSTSMTGAPAPAAQATQGATPATPPVPLGAVPMTIGLRSLQGSNHFEIRLDPGELGRIDVSLDIDKERGTVMAHLVVDRIETLALLQRDAGSLQQALSQAGLDASEANINLSLRSDTPSGGQGSENQGADGRRPDGRPGGPGLPHQAAGQAVLDAIPMRTLRGLTGLDIRI